MEPDKWLDKITANASLRQIAKRAKIADRTLSRQVKEGRLSAEMIMTVAEAYDSNPLPALVDAGYMSARWLVVEDIESALRRASDAQLTDTMLLRLKLLRETAGIPADQLAERRTRKISALSERDSHDGDNLEDQPYAADDSEDEPMEGDEDYGDGP